MNPALSQALIEELSRSFGFSTFRPHQAEIVQAILDGRDVFAALPTGGGKSLCYQLPALMRPGFTVVVSPLIALMKDQVDAATENGIPAAFLNSTLSTDDARAVWRRLAERSIRLLYVSPERLSIPEFRGSLAGYGLSLIAVDEAHCISEWGHEFRPDYRSLGQLRRELPQIPIAAFTATATAQVQDDIVRLLGLRGPFIVRASFDRPEIFYRVMPKRGDGDAQIRDWIMRRPGQPGIVYRVTRKAVERTAELLSAHGISAAAYHAGLEDERRHRTQDAFVKDELTVVVATIAFGMGIDKSNVRWVVHGDLPRSLEGYYQETGRAARDGEDAETVLFHGPADSASVRWHINNIEDAEERARAEARLREVQGYVAGTTCRRARLLAHFGEHHPGACGRCDVCVETPGSSGPRAMRDATEEARMALSAAARTGERFGGHHLADILVGSATDKVMERGHNMLPTFGIGKTRDRSFWLTLIQELAGAGLLVRGEGRTAGYRLSDAGRLLLRGKSSFASAAGEAAGAAAGPEPQGPDSQPEGPQPPASPAQEEALLQRLKALRRRLASARGVPPYIVFSDKTLRIIARERPTDSAGLLRCAGVGERKLEIYGSAILEVIRDFGEVVGGARD